MVQIVRSAVRTSWVSVALATVLGVTMPAVATMAGTALASPIAMPGAIVTGDSHTGAMHEAAPPRTRDARGGHHRRASGHPTAAASPWERASMLVHVRAGGVTAYLQPSPSLATVGRAAATSRYSPLP